MVPRKRIAALTIVVAFGASGVESLAQTPVPAAAPRLADTIEQRVAACAICHGKQGEGTGAKAYYPRIAGKPARYLYLQLQNFREGRRSYPQMIYLMRYMPDAYLQEIADYYAKLSPPFAPPAPPPASPGELARGEALATKGDVARRVPACNACHGKALGGMQPAIPGLVGLGFDYVSAQLTAWKTGARAANVPDCMREIASRLTAADISAVAKWVATQPGSVAVKPVPDAAQKLPLSCGSQTSTALAQTTPPDVLARGEYLTRAGDCVACHTTRGGQPFAGGLDLPTPFGSLVTPNITPDRETGIGKWSADDFWSALHLGRAPDGSPYYPAFPYTNYTRVTRTDADAIFAYLKSVPAVRKKNRPHGMAFPYNQRALLNGWRALYFDPGVYENASTQSAEWNRGAYLVQGLGHCDACHTGRNILGATKKGAAFSGGVMPIQEWYAPSLTSNRESGLGQWDVEDIVGLLHAGVSRRGAVYGPMAQVVHDSLQYLTESDVRAMAVYLKSLIPKDAAAEAPPMRTTEQQGKNLYETGAKVYEKWCADCHGANGAGMPPAYPPLANNQSISMEFPANPVRLVMFGGYPPATKKNPRPYGMPPFAQTLTNEEIAAVVTYIRQSWGNRAAPVSPADVDKYRTVPLE